MTGFLINNLALGDGKDKVEIPAGTRVEIIRHNYIPKFHLDKLPKYEQESIIRGDILVFYYRARFVGVPKENINMPRYLNWQYNN